MPAWKAGALPLGRVPRAHQPPAGATCPPPASNREPPGLQPGALPPELGGLSLMGVVRSPGIEPGTSCSQSRRVTQLPHFGGTNAIRCVVLNEQFRACRRNARAAGIEPA